MDKCRLYYGDAICDIAIIIQCVFVGVVGVVVTKWFCVHSAETVRDMPIITTGRNYSLTLAIIFAIIV